jgi:exonuclease III
LGFREQDRTVDSSTSLHIFHQNIRGLRSKIDELINSFEIDNINPHILCFTKHHMEEQDLLHLTLPGYILGSSFCHRNLQRGGVCIFVRKGLYFNKIGSSHNSRENDLEICAVEIETKATKLFIFRLYIAPTGDFNQFIKRLDDTLKLLYKPKAEFLICGDINTDYLMKATRKNN